MTVTAPGSWRSLDVRPRYTQRHIHILMPLALWGIEPERPAPLPEHRGSGDGRSSDMPAMLADMQAAWDRCRLGRETKRALFYRLALGLPQAESAARQLVSERTARAREQLGMLTIMSFLNGAEA